MASYLLLSGSHFYYSCYITNSILIICNFYNCYFNGSKPYSQVKFRAILSYLHIKSLNTYYGDIDNIFILYTFTHYTYAVALLKYSLSLITGCGVLVTLYIIKAFVYAVVSLFIIFNPSIRRTKPCFLNTLVRCETMSDTAELSIDLYNRLLSNLIV